ncbi:MAG: sigma-70 family RNA polymerase sigma factor [Planctomycetes bacterium]|nr:sigma-70 family RNA polymerase sigma factor [Planctomycetota bacterium]
MTDTADSEAQFDFAERFIRSQDRVFAFIVTQLPHWQDAEDVFQQSSLVLWKKREEYDPQRDFVRWACGIAFNEVRNFRQKRNPAGISLSDEMAQVIADLTLDSQAEQSEELEALAACIEKLPAEQQELLKRSYSGRQTIRELASLLETTADALYIKVRRIRQTVLRCIQRTLMERGS